jgi:hypothetical protein
VDALLFTRQGKSACLVVSESIMIYAELEYTDMRSNSWLCAMRIEHDQKLGCGCLHGRE